MSSKDTMPTNMRKIITDFFGNTERLKSEWDMCNVQYREARETLNNKDALQQDRLEIRKVTDYWVRRRQALERVINSDLIKKFTEN